MINDWCDLLTPRLIAMPEASRTPILDLLRKCNGYGWINDRSGEQAKRAIELNREIYGPRWMCSARYDLMVKPHPGIISLNCTEV